MFLLSFFFNNLCFELGLWWLGCRATIFHPRYFIFNASFLNFTCYVISVSLEKSDDSKRKKIDSGSDELTCEPNNEIDNFEATLQLQNGAEVIENAVAAVEHGEKEITSSPKDTLKSEDAYKTEKALKAKETLEREYFVQTEKAPKSQTTSRKLSQTPQPSETRKTYTWKELGEEVPYNHTWGSDARVVAWRDIGFGTRVVVARGPIRSCKYDVMPASHLLIPFVKNLEQRMRSQTDAVHRKPQIVGVAYHDDGSGSELMNPVTFLQIKRPPITYIKILWDHMDTTWETRTEIRKMFGGDRKGDMIIFAAAQKFEKDRTKYMLKTPEPERAVLSSNDSR